MARVGISQPKRFVGPTDDRKSSLLRVFRGFVMSIGAMGVVFALVACGSDPGSGQPGNQDEFAATPTATPLTGAPVLGGPVWTRTVDPTTKEPATPVAEFIESDEVLYVAFPILQWPAHERVTAQWFYNDTLLDGMTSSVLSTEDRTGGWFETHLDRVTDDPWPDGKYRVELVHGGVKISETSISMVEAD